MIEPTLGRIVWYTPRGALSHDKPVLADRDGRCAATVCAVLEDGTVNLAGFDAHCRPYAAHGVTLLQDGDKVPGEGHYCEWMPYQKGQAAKTEAAEAAKPHVSHAHGAHGAHAPHKKK